MTGFVRRNLTWPTVYPIGGIDLTRIHAPDGAFTSRGSAVARHHSG